MSIQSVDNFQINVSKPIDSRMVTSGTMSRTNLAYKYEGLRVYDTINKAPYVWIDGAWQQESSGSGGSGSLSVSSSGTINRVLKYTTSDTIGNSTIVDFSTGFNQPGSTNVGIGRNPNSGYALDVNGKVRGSIFEMSVNTLEGSYLKDSSVSNDKIAPHTVTGYVLKTVGSSVQWVSDDNTSLSVNNQTSVDTTHYLLFTDVTTNTGSGIFANNATSRLIGVKPSTSQILGSSDSTTNGSGTPAYSFSGTTDSGLYGNSAEIGLSFAGKALLKLNSTTISLSDTSGNTVLSAGTGLVNFGTGAIIKSQATSLVTSPDYTWTGDLTTGMYRPATNQVALTTNGVARFTVTNTMSTISTPTTLSSTLAVTGAATFSSRLAVSGATTLSSTLAVTSAATFSSTLAINASNPFALLITNTQAGIQTTTNGEFFRSIQNTGINYNYMAFYKSPGTLLTHRRGYIGYGAANNDNFIIRNETINGSVVIYTSSLEMLNISGATFSIKSTLLDITDVKLRGLYSNNEFNFINNDAFNSNPIYINYRGAATNGVTGYRFHNGKADSAATGLVPIYTGGVQIKGGTLVKNHLAGYILFVRNSAGGGFGYYGDQKGGVTAVTDVSGSGSSFASTSGWITVNITFASNTFTGGVNDNIVVANYGFDSTDGNILYYGQHIAGKVLNDSTLQIHMRFQPIPSSGYTIKLNFIVQSI